MPDEHPFLTPRGLRLQQSGRFDQVQPNPLPTYPPIQSIVEDGRKQPKGSISRSSISRSSGPSGNSKFDPFDFSQRDQAPIHNLVPANRYPQPTSLARTPLDSLFRVQRVDAKDDSLQAVGKLFIQLDSNPQSPLASGSAWLIGPNTIATAAHNLYDTNRDRWSNALRFYPGFDYYQGDPSRFPSAKITAASVPKAFLENPAADFDVAIGYLDRNLGDSVPSIIKMEPVDDVGFYESNSVTIVGYPAGSSFDFAKAMWQSNGDYLFARRTSPTSDPNPVFATSFGGGCSGGPWLARKDDQWVAVGISSGHAKLRYTRGEHPLASLMSPMFSDRFFQRLETDPVFHEFSS